MSRKHLAVAAVVMVAAVVSIVCLRLGANAETEGELTMPRILPESYVAPVYPEDARKAGVEGRVLVEVLVTEDGAPAKVSVKQGVDGYPSMGKSAVDAVRQWRFEPATRDGEPSDIEVTVPIEFRLSDKEGGRK